MMILYGHPESGHTYKVAMCLALAGEPYRYQWVDVFAPRADRDPEFQRASRFGEIPVLVDTGIAYAQSNAILLHLAIKLGKLGGENAASVARVRERLFWEANRIGISLPNLRHLVRFDDGVPPAGVLDWLRQRMTADLDSLDRDLTDQPFLMGGDVTVADLSCSAYLLYDDMNLDLTRWPGVAAWLARIRALPAWREPAVLLGKPS